MNGILAKKLGMTQIFLESGEVVPVTVLQAGPCQVVQVKTAEKDGYSALQVGFEDQKAQRLNKAETGHFAKAGVTGKKYLAEFTAENPEEWEIGKEYGVDIFEGVGSVTVSGLTKGHGFSGTIKRYGFSSGPRSHGTGNVRAPGSIGACSYPGRVFPGKKMPGHYGNKKHTVKNLKLVKVDAESNLLFVRGAVPGAKNSLIKVSK